jgi:hypothetical protein
MLTKEQKQFLMDVWSIKGKNSNVMTRKQWNERKKKYLEPNKKACSQKKQKKQIKSKPKLRLRVQSPAPGELLIAERK